MARETYEAQIALLVRILPYVANERIFALKGGTAINPCSTVICHACRSIST